MDITTDKLLQEIGRLTVTNQILTQQLAASRQELVKFAASQAEPPSEDSADPDTE